jgi:hypothetical protein
MNAKEEFLEIIEGRAVRCAVVGLNNGSNPNKLPICYSSNQYNKFIESLNFDYNDSYGLQELYGTIWFLDNTWATRGEYDGSEWWELHVCPEVPDNLI